MAVAHTANDSGKRHDLVEHLRGVASIAAEAADKLGAASLAHYLGLWRELAGQGRP